MTNSHTSPLSREALDEFIRQLFACHWVLGQMIAGMLERAQSGQYQGAIPDDVYSMIRSAIRDVVDRYGAKQIAASTKLIDEVIEAISNDSRLFPGQDGTVTSLFPDRD
jgi:hypothetical protein